METKILDKDHADLLLNKFSGESIYINQTAASKLLNVSRQRVYQYVKHPEHSKNLGVTIINGTPVLDLKLVMLFKGRNEFRGKRGKRKINKINNQLASV